MRPGVQVADNECQRQGHRRIQQLRNLPRPDGLHFRAFRLGAGAAGGGVNIEQIHGAEAGQRHLHVLESLAGKQPFLPGGVGKTMQPGAM